MSKYIFSLVLLSLLCCGKESNPISRLEVVGSLAQQTSPGEWASTVAITRYDRVHCSGTLLNPKLVVTAAHCLAEGSDWVKTLRVYIGDGIKGGRIRGQYGISRAAKHPEFAQGGNLWGWADIAWLELETAVEGVEIIAPALRVEELTELTALGAKATLVGFGIYDLSHRILGLKHTVDAPIKYRTAQEIYLGDQTGDACGGDSGGPAFGRLSSGEWRVFGVTSRGPNSCANESYPGVWGVIAAHACWIEQSSGVSLGAHGCQVSSLSEESELNLTKGCQNLGEKSDRDLAQIIMRRAFLQTQKELDCSEVILWARAVKTIDLRFHMLKKVDLLRLFSHVEELDLEDNEIQDPSVLLELKDLKKVRLGWNDIQNPSVLQQLRDRGVDIYGESIQKNNWKINQDTKFLAACLAAQQDRDSSEQSKNAIAIRSAACLGDECSCYTANQDLQRVRDLTLKEVDQSVVELLSDFQNLQFIKFLQNPLISRDDLEPLKNLRRIDFQE